MVTVRTAKAKGSSFEYDCQESLQQVFDNVHRTAERGYQRQYDIHIEFNRGEYTAVECKRLKGISWNQLVKFYEKLKKVAPDACTHYLLFQSNRQPVLVFYNFKGYRIATFEDIFTKPFVKHKSTRAPKIARIDSKAP